MARETIQPAGRLRDILRRIDGRGYKAYKDCEGAYAFDDFTLIIDHAQGDPFAAPSRVRVRVAAKVANFPAGCFSTKTREVAFRDFLARGFAAAIDAAGQNRRGSGKSGQIAVARPGQEVLERSSVVVTAEHAVEVRFTVGLPARGRSVLGRQAEAIFFEDVPALVRPSLLYPAVDAAALDRHLEVTEDADHLRSALQDRGLVAFVADGAVLPRASGVDDRPLKGAVPFVSPPSLRVEIDLPNRGTVAGMGVPAGITLIVGGGFHGKSTLLRAIERGVYTHVPGDGREYVVADPTAVKIRAEDGRRVEQVDISPFIADLPDGRDTRAFSTENASGSTSQAANIMEALESGTRLLLIDEDTAATNMMIRDRRMQELVADDQEPITPFIDRARALYRDLGVSTVLVIGGSGDYFDIADTVVCMQAYRSEDATARAQAIAARYASERFTSPKDGFGTFMRRVPEARSIDASKGRREAKVAADGVRGIRFGVHEVDLSAVAQVVDPAQTAAIAHGMLRAKRQMNGRSTLAEVVRAVAAEVEENGLDALTSHPVGGLAAFRPFELAAALNRLRAFRAGQTR
ncbi:ABC-ATPase domain-containing protein [Methanofollis formosanus]|uniref:ABC-ATPase domain-containing protein n=1 Tax=Methanofollis formosanus TaxID=299308 RepID=UPI001C7D1B40|nr:ABC-ATPase domain-containing protein [Methanofollis formosanus]